MNKSKENVIIVSINDYGYQTLERWPIINEIASKYNGGGHPLASGARVKNTDDIDKLFAELDNECLKYNKKN